MTETLYTKYRPKKLSEVVGQDPIIASLSNTIARRSSQAFLFCGPSGTGKTTLSRICARMLGCKSKDRLEIDAATFTGVDDMRRIKDTIQYKPFGDSTHRSIIVDECHRLSRQAWDSLLKAIEEPPEHISWFFCTTEAGKVPDTIRTRCTSFTLKPVSDGLLTDLVTDVAKQEKIKLNESVRGLIVKEASGSPRQALVNLEACRDVTDRKTAADILRSAHGSDSSLEFARFIVNGGSWIKAMALIEKLSDINPESIRILTVNYIGTALKNAKTDREVCHLLSILENFSVPFNASEGIAPLLLALGRCRYGGQGD